MNLWEEITYKRKQLELRILESQLSREWGASK